MSSDAMSLIHALQAMQDNSLLSFAKIHFPSEMCKAYVFTIHVNIMDVLVLVDGGSFIGS